jgi:hypothetical protein
MASMEQQLAGLSAMSPAQLRAEWRRLYRSLPPGLSSDLLIRGIAWRLQEKVHGGLPTSRQRELAQLGKQLQRNGDLDVEREINLKPGTRLVRSWRGRSYRILVLDEGFQFEDRRYASLTQIARAITGAAWSGPRFFGLKRKGRAFADG